MTATVLSGRLRICNTIPSDERIWGHGVVLPVYGATTYMLPSSNFSPTRSRPERLLLLEQPRKTGMAAESKQHLLDVCVDVQSGKTNDIFQSNFNHILRLLNTNVDGKQKVVYSLT